MKKIKVLLTVVLSICLLAGTLLTLSACSSKEKDDSSASKDGKKKIGIIQIVEHPSLNTIRETFIEQLEKNGFKDGENITIDYQNAQNDQTNLKTIAKKFATNKYDLIVAIATPSALAAAGETKDIPVLFSAVTDPVSAQLVKSLEKPGGNVTGTSDAVSAAKIMELAMRITPEIKTIGALYNSSEINSISVINDLKEFAKSNGLTVVEATVTSSSEVQQAVQSLVGKTDAIFSPIDNTVASAMPVVAQIANKAKIPVYVGADSMVKDGGLATYGINYPVLGRETADMAAEILKGKNPGDMPVRIMTEVDIYINKATADEIGLTIPEDVLNEAAEIFGE
ncbi:peptide ABC transporter substrate-binding protein [Clostridium thermosuccinogenes]|jgi:putative ABC transport system substrate-binding protein|uniref:Peptide ABC transporter substrate-binding protein n=1 Tax=Clostridium thermosuccinogenes TaxID=84032 RepID=A0A2K2FNX8_9CLOT|nr:ABC transporter substrate-binding protein [Pseudoclostridium thermosuccinogenes]AUS95597.1 peptide ABC transporter substrate-binding protein [Pseudoclostridium thermosuccinogenes]PNT90457.1 peptide ABC transporter substrate-binding protein [Pseudoclostridium thermosuccinogenes]PNT98414.1 peptide ABC transporter substrate-binding protein [Pseudoclostridium thermosuccinogenes]PNU00482.1 peptide ABC transporter substrate-binding protein [Pseudoclostridium thermosuccinogenes]